LSVIVQSFEQVTHFSLFLLSIIFEAQFGHLAYFACSAFTSTSTSSLCLRMNTARMDRFVYVKDLKLSEPQELKVPLVDTPPELDRTMLLGKNFDTYCTKTEKMVWDTLQRTPLQNFPDGDTAKLTKFTFYTVLPLEKMADFFVKHELTAEDFEFTGEGLPINFSLNPRSALLFFQFSQTLASMDGKDNFASDFWLVSFRLELDHLASMRQNGTLGLWNRLYVDHLFTTWHLKFTNLEWSTLRAWTFDQKVSTLVNALNCEMLSNSSSNLKRLYHLVLPRDFYNLHFTDEYNDNDWELINREGANFTKHTQTLQSLEWLDLNLSTSSKDTPVLSRGTDDTSTSPLAEAALDTQATQTLTSDVTDLADEVFITSGGARFHLTGECKGLSKRTNPLELVPLEEAKLARTFCGHCSDLTHIRTSVCCTPGCNFRPTWHPHFCCRRCKEGKHDHGRLCSRVKV